MSICVLVFLDNEAKGRLQHSHSTKLLFSQPLHICQASQDITMAGRDSTQGSKAKSKWYKVQWFSDQDSPKERKLITKLDLLIVPYAFLAYWVKYIDQNNLSKSIYLH